MLRMMIPLPIHNHIRQYHNLERKGKSMFTEPWFDPRMPFRLFAQQLFRKGSIFSRVLRRTPSSTPIFTRFPCSPFTFTMTFILVKIATAFLMVSEEMDSRWVMMRSLSRDWPNHWISLMNLGAGEGMLFLSSLKRQRQVIQQDSTTGHTKDQQKLKQLPVRFIPNTRLSQTFIICREDSRSRISEKRSLLEMGGVDRQNQLSRSAARKQLCSYSSSTPTSLVMTLWCPKLASAVATTASWKKMWAKVLRQQVSVNSFTKEFWSKLTWISNISFFDFYSTPSSRDRVLLTEMEESAWLRAILIPREEISLLSQLVFSCRESSEMPLRCISTTLETMAGPVTTDLLDSSWTILLPNFQIFQGKVPCWVLSHSFTEMVSHNSRQILPQFSFKTSTAFTNLDRLSFTLASPIISQVKLLPSSTRSQLMVTGRMCASIARPSATLLATRESMPNLGASIFPVLLLVPSMKNQRQ